MKITIVGAGLVGSLLAILLARRGHEVQLVERRPDPKSGRIVGGRSINLALSDRGLLALERAGLAEDIKRVAVPMQRRIMHGKDGALSEQAYGLKGEAILSVSRSGLNNAMIELAQREQNVRLIFEKRCVGVDIETPRLFVASAAGERIPIDTELLIGADGAFSVVRYEMQKLDRFDYSQTYLEHGYKELVIPAGPGGSFLLEKHALHIWPRESFMLIALPNQDGSFTCTLFFPLEGKSSFATLPTHTDARAFFEEHFKDAVALMPTFDADWDANPTSTLATFRTGPWHHDGKVMLIGDAAHGIVPFFGQGMNAGFEDCRVLMEVLDETRKNGADDFAAAMPAFFAARKQNTDAIAELALENFVEMRDKVGRPAFLQRKRVEAHLARLLPGVFVPAYTMVTFSPQLPYSEARARARRQDRVLDEVFALPGIDAALTSGALDEQMKQIVTARLR
jgi:kynurenine 3-monooxygenase